MTKKKSLSAIIALGAVATAIAFGVATAKPAAALPSYSPPCSSCHAGAVSGTVTAVPSTTTLTTGQAYTVKVTVGLSASGKAGYRIMSGDAGTPTVDVHAGPGASPFTANMTAPAAAGTYTYTVWGAKGAPSSGQATTGSYQITVTSGGGGGGGTTDTVKPTTLAPSSASVKKGKTATIKYQVNDALPNLGTAKAVITIKSKAGKVVKTLKPSAVAVNALQQVTFKCKLAAGKYKFSVSATDAAGNPSSNIAVNKLTVK